MPYGPFLVVETGNGVSLDYADGIQTEFTPQHYAFLVSDDDFDAIKARLEERNVPYWADPFHREPGRINTDDGGRGLYWDDPDGHVLEIITVPYGG
jgi:extradiol dioxygenase family protein